MVLRLDVDVRGVEDALRRLRRTRIRVNDLRPVWDDILQDFADRNKKAFDRGGHPGGTQWAAVNENYAKAKAAAGFGTKILVREERLMKSLTQTSNSEFVNVRRKTTLKMGTEVPYAIDQHRQDRPAVEVTNAQKRFIARTIEAYLARGL